MGGMLSERRGPGRGPGGWVRGRTIGAQGPVRTALGILLLLLACAPPSETVPDSTPTSDPAGWAAWGGAPQTAEPEDIRVFEPYIGRFRSPTRQDPNRGAIYFAVHYRWFDTRRSIVHFRVTTVREDDGSETVNAEGFYGHDPFQGHLYAFGAFTWGATGFGAVGSFDPSTRARTTWARSISGGEVTWVRDEFEIVDQDTWTDVTWTRTGEDGEWQKVYEDTFTRVHESAAAPSRE